MKRKHKKYSRPKRPFDKQRIEDEKKIIEEFGLKNKKEIWKAEAKIKNIREKAKRLISASEEEKNSFFEKLNEMGLNVKSIGDVLSLDKKDYLNRRLQTVLVEKKFAPTMKGARQLIVHKKVFVGEKNVSSPSYLVTRDAEKKIQIKKSLKKEKQKLGEKKDEQEE